MPLKVVNKQQTDQLARTARGFQGNLFDVMSVQYTLELDQRYDMQVSSPVDKLGLTFTLSSGNWTDLIGAFNGANIEFKLGNGAVNTTTVVSVSGASLTVASITGNPADGFYDNGYFKITDAPEQFEVYYNLVRNSVGTGTPSLVDGNDIRFVSGDISGLAISGTDTLTQTGIKSGGSIFTTALLTRIADTADGNLQYTLDLEYRFWVFLEIYFQSSFALGDFAEFSMWMEQGNASLKTTSSHFQAGNTGLIDENFNGLPPAFTLDSIVWTDNSSNVMDTFDYSQESNFEITILGNFDALDKFNIKFYTIPDNASEYQNKPNPIDNNLMLASNATLIAPSTPTNITGNLNDSGAGVNLQNVESTIVPGVSMTITGRVIPNSAFETLFSGRSSDDRKYRLLIETETNTLGYKASNRVNVDADFQDSVKNIIPLGRYTVSSEVITDHNNIDLTITPTVYLEDDILATWEFLFPKSTTNNWNAIKGRVVAENLSTGDRFTLEELTYNVFQLPVLPDDTLPLDYTENRGFKLPATSDKHDFIVERNPGADTGTDFGVRVKYPMIIRYEDWVSLPTADNYFYGNKTQNWYTYSSDANWQVKIELVLETNGGEYINGYVLDIHDYDDWGETSNISFERENGTPITKPSATDITVIKATHQLNTDTWNGSEYGLIHVRRLNNAPQWTGSSVLDYSDVQNPIYPIAGQLKTKIDVVGNLVTLTARLNPALLGISSLPSFANQLTFTSKIYGDTTISGIKQNIFLLDTTVSLKPYIPTIPDFNEIVEENRGGFKCCDVELKLADLDSEIRRKNDVTGIALVADTFTAVIKDSNGNVTSYTPPGFTVCPNDSEGGTVQIEWRDVALSDGFGCYTVEIQSYTVNGVLQPEFEYMKVELKPYESGGLYNGEGTTRILSEFNNFNNEIGLNLTGTFLLDSVRLDGKSGYNKPNTEIDNVVYLDGRKESVRREDFDTYELKTGLVSNYFYRRLRTHVLGETRCWLSDHNFDSPDFFFFDKEVIVKEGIEPEYFEGSRQLKAVIVFEDKIHYLRSNFAEDKTTAPSSPPPNPCPPAAAEVIGTKVLKTNQTVSYRTGDDGDIQAGRDVDFYTLPSNNPFGNTNRFTDELGTQVYANNILLDWTTYDGSTVLMYYLVQFANDVWNNQVDACLALSVSSFTTGWRIWNKKEAENIIDSNGVNPYINPIGNVFTGTTYWAATGQAWVIQGAGAMLGLSKIGTFGAIAVRTTTNAELGI